MSEAKKAEDEALKFWKENKIYEKSVKKNMGGKKFYMMDGPPYATGHIHLGTALNKILKDIAMRSQRLQGKEVFDRPGYDTHGVPIEFQIEKEIGSKSKKDIEKYGVGKFVERCKKYATQYIDVMNSEFANLGVWMDWKNPYLTLSDEYIEAIWAAFKEADKKGLLYLGKYPVHICTRCETAVAYNEIEYGKQKDNTIFVKFPLKEKGKENTFLLIWTSTPWTLPGNAAVMVHPEVDYQEVEVMEGERWIIAKDLVPAVMSKFERGFTVKDEFKGKKMEGWRYENPLSRYIKLKLKKAYRVILSARYVTTEDGTGLVHCGPGHGKEDYEVAKEYGLDIPTPVEMTGMFNESGGKYAGKKAREVDWEIIEDLRKDNALVYEMEYEHDYPLCWRDKSPLLMTSIPQWFLKISKIQDKLLKENEKVKWWPGWMKLRMKAWLEGIGDWPVSRQRYWGTPLPIWHDPESGERIVVGSIDELKKLSGEKNIDAHKPGIDKITIKSKSGKVLKRVPEVLDVWFDSGVSSWAALGYPCNHESFKKFWPADINIEGKDQVRGWWNSQFILSQILFDRKPFEAIVEHGMIMDIGKRKMSKSLGNIVTPEEVVEKHGRDYLRYYFAKLSKGDDFSFDEEEFKEIGKVITILLNVNMFVNQIEKKKTGKGVEDRWILSKFNSLIKNMAWHYNEYDFPAAVQDFESFLVSDMSRAYIQMIRERAEGAFETLNEIRMGLIKLIAPIMPLLTEKIWQELRKKNVVEEESIHLSEFPKADGNKIDENLESEFNFALKVIEMGLKERDKAKIGLKWPLAKLTIHSEEKISGEIKQIIARQLNVKSINEKKGKELKVELDTAMTPELEAEGFARELARKIQSERKNAGMKKGEAIDLKLNTSSKIRDALQNHIPFLKERTNSKIIEFVDEKETAGAIVFTVKDQKIIFSFRNLRETSSKNI